VIPDHSHTGVLPPFLPGASPHMHGAMSPYKVSLLDVAQKFATSAERITILKGLVAYRDELRSIGIRGGFQWIDGSFVEECEKVRGRPPKDVDLITFSVRPPAHSDNEQWKQLIHSRPDLFNPEESKETFYCDAYFVDLAAHPIQIVNQTRYWFGLFSHQRDTFLWKGMLEIPFTADDSDVLALLTQGETDAS
jgi:hypothetical protein